MDDISYLKSIEELENVSNHEDVEICGVVGLVKNLTKIEYISLRDETAEVWVSAQKIPNYTIGEVIKVCGKVVVGKDGLQIVHKNSVKVKNEGLCKWWENCK